MRTPVNHHLGINKPFAFDCTSESPDCTGGTVLLKRLLFLDVIHNKLGTFILINNSGPSLLCVRVTMLSVASALQNGHRSSLGFEWNRFCRWCLGHNPVCGRASGVLWLLRDRRRGSFVPKWMQFPKLSVWDHVYSLSVSKTRPSPWVFLMCWYEACFLVYLLLKHSFPNINWSPLAYKRYCIHTSTWFSAARARTLPVAMLGTSNLCLLPPGLMSPSRSLIRHEHFWGSTARLKLH